MIPHNAEKGSLIAWREKEGLIPGAVIAIQTFGDFLVFNPHCHVLVADGCFYGRGMFRVAPSLDLKKLEAIFRHKVFKMLLAKGKITREIAEGKLPGIYFDKVRFNDLSEALKRDYRINAKKNLAKIEAYLKTLFVFFGEIRVTDITTEKIERFIEKRKEDGLANSSINRELAALKRMFHLGARARKVDHIPYIPMLKESNTRKGFFDHREFLALREALPSYLKPVVSFAYHTG